MAQRITPARFPRGVADTSGNRAFLRGQAGALVALDLRSGNVLWRTTEPMRPLLARNDKIVAVRVSGPHTLEVVVLSAADGKELLRSKPLILPEWANVSLDNTPDFRLHAEGEDGSLFIRWAARNRYRGGAAPGKEILQEARRDASGEARLDVKTGAIEELLNGPGTAPEPLPDEERPASAPDVLEQRDVGNKSFQLLARDTPRGAVQMLVRALDPKTADTLWETVVDETLARRPKPPRP
jgi:PQQ-like domain